MQVSHVVAPQADIIRITSVRPNDCYKRLDKPTYGAPKIVFGVITDVLMNGDDTVVHALEFEPVGYGSSDAQPVTRTFTATSDFALFPCGVAEYADEIGEAIAKQERSIEETQKSLDRKHEVLRIMLKVANSEINSAPAGIVGEGTLIAAIHAVTDAANTALTEEN